MKRVLLIVLSVVTACLAYGCGAIVPDDGDDGDNERKAITLTTKQGEYVQASTRFAYRFLTRIDENELKNGRTEWFVSPLSLQFALGMLLNAAQGETADEISVTAPVKPLKSTPGAN